MMFRSLKQPAGRLRAAHGEGPLRASRRVGGSFATINIVRDTLHAVAIYVSALYMWRD